MTTVPAGQDALAPPGGSCEAGPSAPRVLDLFIPPYLAQRINPLSFQLFTNLSFPRDIGGSLVSGCLKLRSWLVGCYQTVISSMRDTWCRAMERITLFTLRVANNSSVKGAGAARRLLERERSDTGSRGHGHPLRGVKDHNVIVLPNHCEEYTEYQLFGLPGEPCPVEVLPTPAYQQARERDMGGWNKCRDKSKETFDEEYILCDII